MEILMGIILLLQVLALIQLMLAHRQVLQRIREVTEKLDAMKTADVFQKDGKTNSEKKFKKTGESIPQEEYRDLQQENREEDIKQKEAQEALINEVLSEVFS